MTTTQEIPRVEDVRTALNSVHDPEIRKPITELDMVKDISVGEDGVVTVAIYLTVAGCPLKDTITRDTKAAVSEAFAHPAVGMGWAKGLIAAAALVVKQIAHPDDQVQWSVATILTVGH